MEGKRIQVPVSQGDFNEVGTLVVERQPKRLRYKPGDEITYDGARFSIAGGRDVTGSVVFGVPEGSAFKSGVKHMKVPVVYSEANGEYRAFITLSRARRILPLLLSTLFAATLVAGVGVTWFLGQPAQGDTGSYLIPKGDMTDEEALDMLNEMAEKSRITVSLAPQMKLREDGQMRVNFIVVEPNNGLSERLEIEQDGRLVYRSGVVEPGHFIEWAQSDGAHAGPAVATVRAVNDGADAGNPVSVEVEIVE